MRLYVCMSVRLYVCMYSGGERFALGRRAVRDAGSELPAAASGVTFGGGRAVALMQRDVRCADGWRCARLRGSDVCKSVCGYVFTTQAVALKDTERVNESQTLSEPTA